MKWKLLAAGCAAALIAQSTLAATVDGDVFSRVTTRAYSEAVIPSTQVDAIVQAGFSAPSALNQRALEFVVLATRNEVEKLYQVMPQQRSLKSATCVIVVTGNREKAVSPDILPLDAGIAVQAILTQAAHMGYASNAMALWPSKERGEQATQALGIPANVTPFMMIAVGKPAADATTSASAQNFDASKIHRGQW